MWMCLTGDILEVRDPRQKILTMLTKYYFCLYESAGDLELGIMNLSDSEDMGADEVFRKEVK